MNPIKRLLVNWLLHFVPPCDAITHQLSESIDHKLSLRDRIWLRLHLYTCDWCTRYGEQIRLVDQVVRRRGEEPAGADQPRHRLSDDARERLRRQLGESHD